MNTVLTALTRDAVSEKSRPDDPLCGARVVFEGVVRGEENGRTIEGLHYEAYEKMAGKLMRDLGEKLLGEFGCRQMSIVHRLGFVPVGQVAVRVEVTSSHRAEAFACAARCMDLLKTEVPIWKRTDE
jgi:molybdopterin synthase catalytic subunit